MTKQLDILATETKNVSTTTPTVNKEVKQEPSLFDKLLGGATKTSVEESKSSLSVPKVETVASTEVSVDDVETTKNLKDEKNITTETKDDKNKTSIKSSSLLDRLVLEAKKESLSTNTGKSSETTVLKQTGELNPELQKTNIKTELTTNEVKSTNLDNNKEIAKNFDNKDVPKALESKDIPKAHDGKEIPKNIDNQDVTKNLNVKETPNNLDNKEEIKNSDLVKKDITKNTLASQNISNNANVEKADQNIELKNSSLIPKVEASIKPELKNEDLKILKNSENEKTITTEVKDDKNNSSKGSSLLDRLVQEASKEVVSKTTENNVSKNSETIQVKQIGEVDSDLKESTLKTELKTNDIKNTNVDNTKEIVKTPDVKEEIKNTQILQSQQNISNNSNVEEVNIKTELKTNEVKNINIDNTKEISKIIDNKEEIKNTDILKKTSVSSPVTSSTQQTVLPDTDIPEINTKTELKTNVNQPLVSSKEEVKNTDLINKETSKNIEMTQASQNPKINTSLSDTGNEKNTKAGNDLASLNNDIKPNEKVNITKNEIESLGTKQKEEPKSLMDSLIEKNQTLKNGTLVSEDESKVLKNTNTPINSKDVISNIYLSSQRNNINNNALSNKSEAVNAVKNATTSSEIEVNAKKLDLNVKDISLETKAVEIKKESIELIDRKNSLDKIILNKNARHNEVNTLITKSIEASKAILEDTKDVDSEITLNVNPSLAQSIQTRIIGARQQMSGMMSDVARQMYENYKPPVTAFRINLNPGTLGSIAIVMKSDKDSGINISLNISNNSTLDAFVDSQNNLRNALNKTFDEGTKFNLDFSSSDQNNDKSDNKENTKQSFTNRSDTQGILESREKNLESEDRNIDYM